MPGTSGGGHAEDALSVAEPIGVYRHPWRVAIIAGLASFVDGAALTANGIALVIYQQTIGLTADQLGLLLAVVTVGLAIGSAVGGRLGDVFGRRKVFIITMAMIVLGSLGPTLSTDFWVLFAGLAVMGLGVGADLPVSLATIAEAANDKNRGAMLVFTQVLWIAASLVVVVIVTLIGAQGRIAGQVLYGLIAVVGAIGLLLRLTVPESPLWLRSQEERRLGIHTVRADKARLRDLVRPPFRRPFLVLLAFFALASIPGNLTTSFIPLLAVTVAGVPVEDFAGYVLIAFPLGFITLGLVMKLVGTRLRMPLVLAGGLLMAAILLIPVAFGITLVTLVLVIGLVGGFTAVLFGDPITRVWVNESFPTMLRATGQGFVFTVGRLVVAALTAVAPAVIAFSPDVFFVGLAASALLGVLVAGFGFRGGRIANEFQHEQESTTELASRAAAG